jgi:general stress protein 26
MPGSAANIASAAAHVVCYVTRVDNGLAERAAEVLRTIRYATVATADSRAQPWNSPVYSAHDDDLNIYWVSDRQNKHSQNVRDNPRVFIVIYNSTVPPGQGEGVYFTATASELTDPDEIEAARTIVDDGDSDSTEEYSGDGVCRIYRAAPERAWINAVEERDGVIIRDYRLEIPLGDLRRAVSAARDPHSA